MLDDELKPWLGEQITRTSVAVDWEGGRVHARELGPPHALRRGCAGALRGPVIGRKNHLGSKSRRGTEVAATFYTSLETAKLHGVNPAAYLAAAVMAAERGVALMSWEIAAAMSAATTPATAT